VTSLHEHVFRKNRLGQFMPRGPKARKYGLPALAAVLVVGGVGLVLLTTGHRLAGQIVLGGLVVLLVVYNGFVSTRSDL